MKDKLPVREEVPAELTWRLEDIYPNEDLWEEELQEAGKIAAKLDCQRAHRVSIMR